MTSTVLALTNTKDDVYTLVNELLAHSDGILAMQFDADRDTLLSVGQDRLFYLYDMAKVYRLLQAMR